MSNGDHHLLVWNAHGLNSRVRRNVVRSIVEQQRASIVCLQETKIKNFSVSLNIEITCFDFDYVSLPASGMAGGAVISWRRDLWSDSQPSVHRFSCTLRLTPLCGSSEPWWVTTVYGPSGQDDHA